MHVGIDYTAAFQQQAGIGRYTRELIGALLGIDSPHRYTLIAAVGGVDAARRESERRRLQTAAGQPRAPHVRFRPLPLSDEWLARLWHRVRLPIPVEVVAGPMDLFYSPDFLLPPTLAPVPAVVTVHDLSFLRYPDHFVPKLVRYLSRAVPHSVRRAERILADSKATRADLVELLGIPADKVEVLYSGVNPRFHPYPEPGERQRLQTRYQVGDPPYVLSVGTLQPRKNLVRLVRAFASLPTSLQSRYQLVLAGQRGWLHQEIEAEAERYPDRVRILGFVQETDLPALYRGAALFAFPSFYEGFGLPVLEAMACGTPVVCSNTSSLPEVAGDAALLVDPHDETGLAHAIWQVLEDRRLRRLLVSRGLAQAENFTWEHAAHQLLDAFNALGG